jgi:ParB-like chromosome segregation protein Spo0J
MSVRATGKMNVPLSKLRIREGWNARTDDDDPEVLAALQASFVESGLVNDVSVVEAPDGLLDVVDGFTRARALLGMSVAGAWPADQLVTVTVVAFSAPEDPYLRNLAENVVRRDLRTADQARRFFELAEGGVLLDGEGKTLAPVSIPRLAESLGKSVGFVRELVRAWRGACAEVREAWRAEEVATDQVRAWCRLEDGVQRAKLAAWRQKRPYGVSTVTHIGPAEDDEGESSEETNGHAKGTGAGDGEREQKAPTRSIVLAKIAAYEKKLDGGGLKGEKLAVVRARWEALRWATGEIRSLR